MMVRKLTVLFLSLVLLCGCSLGKKTEEGPAESAGPITVEVWGPAEAEALVRGTLDQFASENGIEIRYVAEADATMRDSILTDIAAAGDVFLLTEAAVEDLKSAGALYDFGGGSYTIPAAEGYVIAVNARRSAAETAVKLAEALKQS